MNTPSTIPDMITATRDLDPDAIALRNGSGSESDTYADLVERSDHLSRSLTRCVPAGERIGVMMDGGINLSRWILAIMWRHTVVPLRPDLSPDDIRRYLTITKTRCLVTTNESNELVRLCADLGVQLLTPDAAAAHAPLPADQASSPTADSVVVVLLTSGSTGTPKVVPLRHRNMLTSTRDMARALHLTSTDRCLVQWSQYHIGGLIDHLLVPLSTGGTIINGGSFSLEGMKRLLTSTRPTWTQFVPATLDEMIRDSERTETPLIPNSLRFIRCVAAPMNETLWDRAELAFGCPVLHAYGMTEASPLVTATPLGLAERARGSTGRSVGPDIRIVDEANRPLRPGVEGEIQIRGANVFDGYEGDVELNAATFVDGWFRTGDLGYLDEDGELYVRGRAKNMINRGGEKINPLEIEDVLRTHPFVIDAAVFAIPHRRLGHVVGAAVSTSQLVEPDAVVDFAARTLSPHKVPAQVLVLDELPRLGVGKIDLAHLVQLAQSLTTQKSAIYRNQTERVIAEIWTDELGVDRLSASASFAVAGGDSLSATRVIAEVERVFDLRGSSAELLRCRTIRAMATTVDSYIDRGLAVPVSQRSMPTESRRWNNALGVDDVAKRLISATPGLEREVELQLALRHLSGDEIDSLMHVLRGIDVELADFCSAVVDRGSVRSSANPLLRPVETTWSRTSPHQYVSVYTRVGSADATSTLLAFAGVAFGIMTPVHRVLPLLPDVIGSMVLIVDPGRKYFASGIPGIAPDISSLAAGLRELCPDQFDRDVRTLGTSAGGLAAAVVGLHTGARSMALVANGPPRSHPAIHQELVRLADSRSIDCDCRVICGVRRRDLKGLMGVRQILPETRWRVYPTLSHNVIDEAWKRGRLGELLSWLIPS